jgi:catechol 2,3-dioxygenase-like lactoylglutathione lyase family enzyme
MPLPVVDPDGAGGSRAAAGRAAPPRRVPHLAARLEAATSELRDRGIAFEVRDYGIAWSVYMPDPDGHLVEITTYEVTRG